MKSDAERIAEQKKATRFGVAAIIGISILVLVGRSVFRPLFEGRPTAWEAFETVCAIGLIVALIVFVSLVSKRR
ncbi:MAG TPA: hypothetical protein VG860_21650 [Terriglobia bacterium]|jgi:hypothetical protein|nr:hypothetical protein [Terriglobia bacterium]